MATGRERASTANAEAIKASIRALPVCAGSRRRKAAS